MIPLRDRNNHSKFSVLHFKIPVSVPVEDRYEITTKTVNILNIIKC